MSGDKQLGLNPAHEERKGDGWVVAATGEKPRSHEQPEPKITHFVDALNREADVKTNLMERIKHLTDVALTDERTGCYNSSFFTKFANEEFDANRDHNRIAIVNFDINGLKQVNDEYGHAKGDDLINNFVAYIKSQLRKGDVLIRVGGDEFIAVCENIHNDPHFEDKLKARMDEISDNSPKSEVPENNISFAHGVAVFRKYTHRDINDTRMIADAVMYARKREMKAKANGSLMSLMRERTGGIPVKEIAKKIEKTFKEINAKLRKLFKGE